MLRSFRYEEIAEDIRRRIGEGEFPEPHRLPSERDLMKHYEVQRNTIRQALTLLESEGWVVVRPKSGAFAVMPAASTRSLSNPLRASGTVLVVNAWNHASTALDSILIGLAQALEDTHLSIQRFNSLPRPEQVSSIMPPAEYLAANNVAGVLLWPPNPADLSELNRLRSQVPLILLDRRILGFEADCVQSDDLAGGRLITEHLIAQGHRRIGFLADEGFAETVQQRWRGYTLALEDAGIAPDPACVTLFHGIDEKIFPEYMRLFLAGAGDPLTAVVCSNDSTALFLLRYLRSARLRVPDDIAVTGYGNLVPHYADALELTTVAQPFVEVGRTAGKLLLQRVAEWESKAPEDPLSFQHIALPVALIARNSSALRRP
jgi:GntR family transcriptional regulator of arabinose operon